MQEVESIKAGKANKIAGVYDMIVQTSAHLHASFHGKFRKSDSLERLKKTWAISAGTYDEVYS